MAVNETRNLTVDLKAGASDGVVKKAAPDRGGVVEPLPLARNARLSDSLYDPARTIEGIAGAERWTELNA